MLRSSDAIALVHKIEKANLSYLKQEKLAHLVNCCAYIDAKKISGDIIEAGCALGGSTICLASAKAPERALYVYDVFGMLPPPRWPQDGEDVHERYSVIAAGKSLGINGDQYYGYKKDLYGTVLENLASFSITPASHAVHLIKGLLQETMVVEAPVALAHVDVDWYDPVKTCLERIYPRLSPGGAIILDDYNAWSGCRKAVDEFIAAHDKEARLVTDAPTPTIFKGK